MLGLHRVPKLPLGSMNRMDKSAMMQKVQENARLVAAKISTPRDSNGKWMNPRRQGRLVRQKLKFIALQRAQTAVKGKLESRAAQDMVKACEHGLYEMAATMIQKAWRSHLHGKRRNGRRAIRLNLMGAAGTSGVQGLFMNRAALKTPRNRGAGAR